MKNNLNRIKKLMNLNEEMETSDSFNKNTYVINKNKHLIRLNVGVDLQNNTEHELDLVVGFDEISGYWELYFAFVLFNNNGNQIRIGTNAYNREFMEKFIPNQLKGKNIFRTKTNEMINKLFEMDKPKKFYIVMFDEHKDNKQVDYFKEIVNHTTKLGYVIDHEGINEKNRYYWKMILPEVRETEIKELNEGNKPYEPREDVYARIEKNIRESYKEIPKIKK